MSANPTKTEGNLTPRQNALLIAVALASFFLWMVSIQSPIPQGKENRDKARGFVQELYPQRPVHEIGPMGSEQDDSVTAPVAVVFHLIRTGEPEVARKAITFAGEQDFGYASPYVIERLGSGDPELEQAAQAFLRKIAGADHGPDADSWRGWWADPPSAIFGIGQMTLGIGVLAVNAFAGILLLVLSRGKYRGTLTALGGGLLFMTWFLTFAWMGIRLVGSYDTGWFGSTQITYHSSHGAVIGLEDAKFGGPGLWFLLMLLYMAIPFLLAILYVLILHRGNNRVNGEPVSQIHTSS